MKVALIADPVWLGIEAGTLRRLIVGLTGEGVRVVPVLPTGFEERFLPLVSDQLIYRPTKWHWLHQLSVRRLSEQLQKIGVDMVHSLEGAASFKGLGLADSLGVPVVCTCWSEDGVEQLAKATRKYCHSSAPFAGTFPAEGLKNLARQLLTGHSDLRLIRGGVYIEEQQITPVLVEPDQAISCLVVTNGIVDQAMLCLLEGFALVRHEMPQVQLFVFSFSTQTHGLWKAAEKLKLLEQVSMVGTGPGTRQLLVQADVLIQPQPLRAVRSVTLEAMAAKRPVIAAADRMVDYLIDGQTARLMTDVTPQQWADLFREIAESPQAFRDLGESARQHVSSQNSAARFVDTILGLYQEIAAEPLPFKG